MTQNCNGCDSQFVGWYEPAIGKSYCGDCAEERNYAGMIETANSLDEALGCLVEASAALTRYRTITQGTRPPFADLTIYEWLTSLVPDRALKDTPEQVMRRVIKEHKHLWVPGPYDDHWAQGEVDRVSELLDELGYGVDELSDNTDEEE